MSTITSEAAILADLRHVLREALGVDPLTPIEPETRFFADLGLASIDAVVLGEALQHHFGRPVPFDELMADLGRRDRARPRRSASWSSSSAATIDGHPTRASSLGAETHMPRVTANGLNFHYQQAGSGPDVVLIHGVTGDLSIWFLCRAMAVLAETHRVTAYDLRGHGYSDAPGRGLHLGRPGRRPRRP